MKKKKKNIKRGREGGERGERGERGEEGKGGGGGGGEGGKEEREARRRGVISLGSLSVRSFDSYETCLFFLGGGGLLGPRSLVVTCTTPHLYDKKESNAALLVFHSENYVLTSFYESLSRALFDGCNFFILVGLSVSISRSVSTPCPPRPSSCNNPPLLLLLLRPVSSG